MRKIKLDDKRVAVLVALAAVAVFGVSVFWGFTWDDENIIVGRSEFFGDIRNLPGAMLIKDVADPAKDNPYYRPVAYLTFFFDMHVWGKRPFGYHLENVLLHALSAALLFFIVLRLSGDRATAVFSALVFAVHPAAAEAVNFLSGGRNTLLSAALMLGSVLVLSGGGGRGGKSRAWRTAAALALFALALLSKEQAVVLPAFVLYWALLGGGKERGVGPRTAAAFFLVAGAYFLLRLKVLGTFTSDAEITLGPGVTRPGLTAWSFFEYFRLMVFPLRLNVVYRAVGAAAMGPLGWGVALAGTGALVALLFLRRAPAALRLGAAWLLLGLLPVVNIIPIPSAPVAERYLYIPLAGFAVLAGHLLSRMFRLRSALWKSAVVVIILLLSVQSYARNFVWLNNFSLYKSMAKSDPGNFVAHVNLGIEYTWTGKFGLAREHIERALEIEPQNAHAYNALGTYHMFMKQYKASAAAFGRALELKPGDPRWHYNLAFASVLADQRERARRHYGIFIEEAIKLPFMDDEYHMMLDKARMRLRELQ